MVDLVGSLLKDVAARAKEAGRPIVTISYAQSLDGSIALRGGQATAISGAESLKMTHQLRAAHDAILVGIGTVQADDPQLTVRGVEGKNPRAVVLDSNLSFPLAARLLELEAKPWIFCVPSASNDAEEKLKKAGALIFRVGAKGDARIDLRALLEKLAELKISSLMVEGGASVIASFLDSGLVDQVAITISAIFIGGLNALDKPMDALGKKFPRVTDAQMVGLGKDFVLWGKMGRAAE